MRLLFTLCIFFLLSCSNSNENLLAGLKYFPEINLLKEGVVFKYYNHTTKKDGQPKTNILYRKMKLKGNVITSQDYHADFQKSYYYEYEIIDNQWIVNVGESKNYTADLSGLFTDNNFSFKENVHMDWVQNEASYDKTVMYDGYDGQGRRIRQIQTGSSDSIANGKAIKIVHGKRTIYSIRDSIENDPSEYTLYKTYEQDLGLTLSIRSSEEYNFKTELDEIMTTKEFERRLNHGTHRVAYIDTLQTIDDHTLFKPCFHIQRINDYYNDQRSGFKGGKGRLRALLNEKLDPEKIKGESGYLTFRFVINCNGEAGWFVTEEAELDYQKKRFSDECRMHIYDILKAEKEWKHLVVREKKRDAYTYITFKMKNGEIIELLP